MNKLFAKAMDPISSETHFIGACLSLLGLLVMIVIGIKNQTDSSLMIAAIVFGISLIALYSASSIYHFFKGSQKIKTILRKLDHSMIYILIVGTYTPVAVLLYEYSPCLLFSWNFMECSHFRNYY